LIAEETQDFVGREYVFDEINSFITSNSKGYFTVIGDPGQGKTAILAKYVQDTGCIAYFNRSLINLTRAEQFLESICNQLIERYQLDYPSLPPNATQDGNFLDKLLNESAQKETENPIVIVVDALDEVDQVNYRSVSNILFLPPHLPNGVYFILTLRRGVDVPMAVYAPSKSLNLLDDKYQADSGRDVKIYIENRINRSETLRFQIAEREETIEDFTDKISDKSENNFLYLRCIISDIEEGEYKDLTLEQFPKGLYKYYIFHWRRMGMTDDPLPLEKIKIVIVLAAVKQAVSQRKVCDYSGAEPLTVQDILLKWRQFLHEIMKDNEKRYGIYHSSYQDFLHGLTENDYPVTFQEIHRNISQVDFNLWENRKEMKKRRHE
jgi:serine/threonine-protein kinase